MTSNIIPAFPVGLYAKQNLITKEENDFLITKVMRLKEIFGRGNLGAWVSAECSPSNCFHIASLVNYLEFKSILDKIRLCVNEFAREAYASEADHMCGDAWYNVYTRGQYQEFHMHPGNIFSAIYFMQIPEGAPGTWFKRPDNGSMLPPKNKKGDTQFNRDVLLAPPEERTVIIFRSNLQHSVPPMNVDGERITIAANYL